MNFTEADIKFEKISWKHFEELCYDLMHKYQFHSLSWRQGGGDKGRDIEALYTVINPLVVSYSEKWFIECKHYSKGIPPEQISGKLDWAVAEKVQHFVLMTSTYPSVPALEYIKKRQKNLNFRIHIIDGKSLKQKLLAFPDLIVKYFADDTTVLIQGLIRQWLSHNLLPNINTLFKLSKLIDTRALSSIELVFLLFAFEASEYDDTVIFQHDDVEEFSFDFLLPAIIVCSNSDFPIKKPKDISEGRSMYFYGGGKSETASTTTDFFEWHYLNNLPKNRMIDIYLKRENKQIEVLISTGTKSKFDRYKYPSPSLNFSKIKSGNS